MLNGEASEHAELSIHLLAKQLLGVVAGSDLDGSIASTMLTQRVLLPGVQDSQPKLAIVMKVIGRTGSRGQVSLQHEQLLNTTAAGAAAVAVSAA